MAGDSITSLTKRKGTPTKGEVSLHADEIVESLSDSNIEGSVVLAVCGCPGYDGNSKTVRVD